MTGKALSGRSSMTLGQNDPRLRRNDAAQLAEADIRIDGSLRLDDRQRLGVTGAIDPGDPPSDSAELRAYVTSLVSALRSAGLLRSE